MRTSTLADLDADTASKHQKLDMINNLEKGLWRDYKEPTGFAKLVDMHPWRIENMMRRSMRFIKYEKNEELRGLEERIFNLVMQEDRRRANLAKETVTNKQIKKEKVMTNETKNNTNSTANASMPSMTLESKEALLREMQNYTKFKMHQTLEVAGKNGVIKNATIHSIAIELQSSGRLYIGYKYRIDGAENSEMISENDLVSKNKRAIKLDNERKEKENKKNSDKFLVDKPTTKSANTSSRERIIKQAYFEGHTYGDYKILEVIKSYTTSITKDGQEVISNKFVNGHRYRVMYKGVVMPDTYTQTELAARIAKNLREIAALKRNDNQYKLPIEDDATVNNNDVVVSQTEIPSNNKIELTMDQLNHLFEKMFQEKMKESQKT